MIKKIIIVPAILVIVIFLITSFDSKDSVLIDSPDYTEEELVFHVPHADELSSLDDFDTAISLINPGKSFIGFKEAVAFKESGGRYGIVNPYGYLGKYQFSRSTLRMMGFKNLDNFLKDTKQQEMAFQAYVSYNKYVLRNEIKRYVGMEIDGVEVTESGILAAAHLAGPGNVKKYLKSEGSNDASDANGATVKYYLDMFSDYDTSLIEANKKPQLL